MSPADEAKKGRHKLTEQDERRWKMKKIKDPILQSSEQVALQLTAYCMLRESIQTTTSSQPYNNGSILLRVR